MMLNLKRWVRDGAVALTALVLGAMTAQAIPVKQLGFALDSSGSVSTANYNLQTQGLAAALAAIPVDSTVEISVIDFGSSVTTHINTVVVDSIATRNSIINTVSTMSKGGGTTNMSGAITTLTSLLTASSNFADPLSQSIINLSTDGSPNSQSGAVAASSAALTAGIDALTSEAIGPGANTGFLQSIVFNPQGGLGTGVVLPADSNPPNPLTAANAWVVPVTDFNAYADVIGSKVEAIVVVPVPGTLVLISLGLLGLGFRRRLAK